MTKVWKRTGAVAVFSPLRATVLLVAIAAVVAAAGFVGGMAAADDDGGSSALAAAPAPDAPSAQPDRTAASTESDRGRRRAVATAYRRGYRKGLRRGQARGRKAPAGFAANTAYVVLFGESSDQIRRRIRLRFGETYWLCAGGSRLCIR